ncbi:baculoviral IAP repeat-containing protein 2 [Cryptotermes secundus]|uniref:baculoviral IAP repeat-containing protein 2 n=1 Tax=Cryptotermes secundus TaxID=105785 RepID=UPI001454DB13|nr:baculoviral IAP repeat-containing protein 2 [Cryptotermes secundus]XP_023710491.2 baculoviral IAP repeat-containing protein 2 [Cryptotermes secundus]XP_023710492.2 baculoviral IAP repeat-containing protein 2 [Cryptotermes secundus]XP_023710493.2 baculoviral IAP repeat-containing protein 2 [Cryptotermes secundus]XP_023710494.2 baculoviral IAP repeat-containing protein 2 [Cryptotermes secundus]XP_023710495.2 baculoviral IAP repeat-containing protein 2 [Cryptotermes secundus]XP_033608010.1 ba
MAPNGTSTTLSLPVENTTTHLKSSMDNVDAPTNDRTPVSSTASSACPPLPLSPIVPVQRPTNYWPMLNMKRESDRRKTYERWVVPFMDPNRLAAAGFYYINQGDVVRCVFCGVEVGHWEEGDDPFRDHQRWAPSCGFVRGLQVGNIPISQDGLPEGPSAQEASRSYDVCGPYLEFRPNSGPERAVSSGLNHNLLTPEELQKHGIHQSRGPLHPSYNTYDARVRSFESWPRSLKQKPDKLSEAGFYYTGKGDQTVCFHCGGGLKDWEETDDPWVEHAVWFPKCIHVVLIKGRTFIEECHRLKEARMPVQDVKDLLDVQKTQASSSSGQCKVETSASASATQENISEEKVIDDARVCQICFVEERGVVFLPCGHLVACVKCAPSLSTCAVCRQPFSGTVRAFLS